jgi:universal stress protein A
MNITERIGSKEETAETESLGSGPRARAFAPPAERVLVCLDGSDRAPYVLRAALELARARGARLQLFRVIVGAGEMPVPNITVVARAERELERLASDVPGALLEGVHATCATAVWTAICAAARERHADLVVIGAHDHGRLARALGTTAACVVNHAPCSVLVVRLPVAERG